MMGPMGDPVTLGEVDRSVQRLREELRDGLANVTQRMDRALDGTVPANVYSSDQTNINYRLNDLEKELTEVKFQQTKKDEASRSQRNLIAAAFIFPLVILILNTAVSFYFKAIGK